MVMATVVTKVVLAALGSVMGEEYMSEPVEI